MNDRPKPAEWTVKYDPDQPRDDHGRWSSGGGTPGAPPSHLDLTPPARAMTRMPTATYDPAAPLYLRVGDWNPKHERSSNYATGDIEMGLSAYDLDDGGEPVVPESGNTDWQETDLRDRMRGDDPKYLVQGDLVATGHDGEPLLRRVRVVGTWRQR